LREPLLVDRQVPLINLADDPSQVSVEVELWSGIAEDWIPEEEGIWWALAHRFKQPDKGWKWREIIESAERQNRDHTFLFFSGL
jgi:hypothetical protein